MNATDHTVTQSLAQGARGLAGASDSPRLDAELLLAAVLGVARTALIVRGAQPLADDAQQRFRSLIERRARGTPVAYLTGAREFWSLPLKITPAVLVPRPETELLVEQALALLPPDEPRTVLDLGTGSGAIALAIGRERPRATLTATDVSAAALEVARENARALGLTALRWRLGSWFEPLAGERFDLIVANPPYVASGDPALGALAAEPRLALCGGPSGLEALAAIIAHAGAHLEPGGSLLLEHGSDQHKEVAALLGQHGFGVVRSVADYAGRPRVTLGTFHSSP